MNKQTVSVSISLSHGYFQLRVYRFSKNWTSLGDRWNSIMSYILVLANHCWSQTKNLLRPSKRTKWIYRQFPVLNIVTTFFIIPGATTKSHDIEVHSLLSLASIRLAAKTFYSGFGYHNLVWSSKDMVIFGSHFHWFRGYPRAIAWRFKKIWRDRYWFQSIIQ